MFSPRVPSPRVAAVSRRPFSYTSAQARPSIFGSQTIAKSLRSMMFDARLCQARRSSPLNALASESSGTRCSTTPNVSTGAPPTRCVGESGVISSGCRASISRSSTMSLSNSASEISGWSRTK